AISADGIVHTALRFRKRRRIEDDQIKLCACFLCCTQVLENILLDPAYRQLVMLGILSRPLDPTCLDFNANDLGRAGTGAYECERALIGETVKNAPARRQLGQRGIMRNLIEIKAGLLRFQRIDSKLYAAQFQFRLESKTTQDGGA